MDRMTRTLDNFPCRIKNCPMENYLIDEFDIPTENYSICDNCPFEKIVNKLAELEDKEESLNA